MNTNKIPSSLYAPFLTTALLIPTASAAIGKNWLPTLVVSLAAVLLHGWLPKETEQAPKWLERLRWLAVLMLAAHFLRQTAICWPGKGAQYVVPAVLAILALYAVSKGEEQAMRSASVLRYGVVGVLIITFYAGIRSVDVQYLLPSGELPECELIIALLLPLLGMKPKGTRWRVLPVAAVLIAVITAGANVDNLYAYSRTISIRGVTEHAESTIACAMTIGYYALLCYLLTAGGKEEKKKLSRFALIGLAHILAITRIDVNGIVIVAAMLLLWGVIPVIQRVKRKMSKQEKSA